jgi:hypothetical protein
VVDPVLAGDGTLTFDNAAVAAGVTGPPDTYVVSWAVFDNTTGEFVGPREEVEVREPRVSAPARMLQGSGFLAVDIRAIHPDYPHWAPFRAYFRREGSGWQTVGLEHVK